MEYALDWIHEIYGQDRNIMTGKSKEFLYESRLAPETLLTIRLCVLVEREERKALKATPESALFDQNII